MKKFTVQHLATAAAVGAVYAVLSIFGSVFGVTFGTVQCRFCRVSYGIQSGVFEKQ